MMRVSRIVNFSKEIGEVSFLSITWEIDLYKSVFIERKTYRRPAYLFLLPFEF